MRRVAMIPLAAFLLLVGHPASTIRADSTLGDSSTAMETIGIDVSHHQGIIGWRRVRGAGVRFAFVKATDGRRMVDPMYARNRVAASAVGIRVGSYHFARPDRTPGDARAEADHFVAVLRLHPGDIPPVLDLEVTGGMGPAGLVAWAREFVTRVRDRTGVKPIIYTSPVFWRRKLGDTRWFAEHGYRLWLARWHVSDPVAPAGNWAGHRWTFWQYTDCGSVPGITGCVDGDRFQGTWGNVTV